MVENADRRSPPEKKKGIGGGGGGRGVGWMPTFIQEIDVSFSCVCSVIDHEFMNFIITLSDARGDSRVDPQTAVKQCYDNEVHCQ